MSEEVTEVVYMPLGPGVDLTTGQAKETWNKLCKTIASQPGNKGTYWGHQIEKPSTIQMLVVWQSLQHHIAFTNSSTYPPLLTSLSTLMAPSTQPQMFHLQTSSSPTPVFDPISAPVTECISCFFDPSHPDTWASTNFAAFAAEGTKHAAELVGGIVGAWSVEEHMHEKLGDREGEEGKAKMFGAFIGWPEVEAHMRFRESEVFGEVVGHMREGPKAMAVHHVKFERVVV